MFAYEKGTKKSRIEKHKWYDGYIKFEDRHSCMASWMVIYDYLQKL